MAGRGAGTAAELVCRAVPYLFLASFAIGWFQPSSSVGIADWDLFYSHAWLAVHGLLERGAPARWTIQLAGGAPLAGDPNALTHTPLLLIPLLFGPIVGIKLLVVVSLALGLVGVQRLGERWIGDPLGASVFAFVFVFSGCFAIHLQAGHLPWAFFPLAVWTVLFADRLLFDGTAGTTDSLGFLASLTLVFVGTVYHSLVFFLIPLGLAYALSLRARPDHERVQDLKALVLCALALTLPRLLALAAWQLQSPRTIASPGGMPLFAFAQMLVIPVDDFNHRVPWSFNGVWEHWLYPGIVATPLAIVGAARPSSVRRLAVAAVLVAFALVWIAPWGNSLARIAPYVPFLDSVRVYSRFGVLVVFSIALLAGAEIARLRRDPRGAWFAAVLSLLIVADYGVFTRPIWQRVFSFAPAKVYPDWGIHRDAAPYDEVLLAPDYRPPTMNSRMLPLLMTGAVVSNAYVSPRLPWDRPTPGHTVTAPPGTSVQLQNQTLDFFGDFAPGDTILAKIRYRENIWKLTDETAARIEADEGGMRIVVLRSCRHVQVALRDRGDTIAWIVAALGLIASVRELRRGPSRLSPPRSPAPSPSPRCA